MKNNEYIFKTDLKCGGCVSKVKEELNHSVGIDEWTVDTKHKDKTLTVKNTDVTPDDIIQILQSKGYNAELLKNS